MMKKGPKIHHLKDVWNWYSNTLLSGNPEWWGVYKDRVTNYYIYRKYTDGDGKRVVIEVFSWPKFRHIIETYYDKAKDAIIAGEAVDMKMRIGKICARRVQRSHNKRVINYAKTMKQPKIYSEKMGREVRAKVIYYTADDWCRIAWNKTKQLTNESVYEFFPTSNTKSGNCFCQQFSRVLTANKLLKYKYPYYPLRKFKEA